MRPPPRMVPSQVSPRTTTGRTRTGRTMGTLLVLLAACRAEGGRPLLTWERMQDQPKYLPYGESRFFPDGMAMRAPPDGTVPRDAIVGRPLLTEGGDSTGVAMRIPLPLTPELLARGRDRFDIFCATCHGVAGDGESVVARKMQARKPPSLVQARVRALPAGTLYRVATEGWGLMPGYGPDLSVTDRWAVVAYVRALQLRHVAPGDSLAPGAVPAVPTGRRG